VAAAAGAVQYASRRMAGLVGVIAHKRSVPVPELELDDLLDAFVAIRGGSPKQRLRAGERAHVGIVEVGPQATVEFSGPSWLAVVGAVHADVELAHAIPSDLDGQFAGVRYDAHAGIVEVFTDPFGMQALYAATRSDRTYISTSAAVLARHLDAAPDDLGMQVFLRAGYQIGPLTHWQGVERLDPALALTFEGDVPRRGEYWMPEVSERVHGMTLEQTADHCAEVTLDIVHRRLSAAPRLWVDLTGGFDSRMVLGAVARAGVPLVANTNGEDGNIDVNLARRVAAAGGFEWRHIMLAPDWAADVRSAQLAAGWADGTLDIFHLAPVLRQHELKIGMSRCVVTGGGGEHFNSFPWQQEFLRAGRSRTVNYETLLTMRYLKQAQTGVLARDPDAAVHEYFREHLSRRARRYIDAPNTTQLDAIYAYKSVGHFGAFRSASEGIVRTEMPCYFRDIFEAVFSAHYRWRTNHRLQRRIIARLSPALAAIPTTRGGSARPITMRNAHQLVPYYSTVGQRAVRKLARRGKPAIPDAPTQSALEQYRRSAEILRRDGLFEPREMRSAPLYDPPRLRAFIARSATPDFSEWGMLSRIATVELALCVGAGEARNLVSDLGEARGSESYRES
jgi:hypothetical protein